MMGAAVSLLAALHAILLAALAAGASAGIAAMLHILWHNELAAVADPLPFLLLSIGAMGWQQASAAHTCKERENGTGSRDMGWESSVARHVESSARGLIGMLRTTSDQPDVCAALHLLHLFFTAAIEEGRRGTDAAAARSASLLAAQFEQHVFASSAQIEPAWARRGVESVAAALQCIPNASFRAPIPAPDLQVSGALAAGLLLLVLPFHFAAAASSAAAAAILAFIAAGAPVLLFCSAQHTSQQSSSDGQGEGQKQQRHRLFNLRMMELQSMAEASVPTTPDVVPAARSNTQADGQSEKNIIGHVINTVKQFHLEKEESKRWCRNGKEELFGDMHNVLLSGGDAGGKVRHVPAEARANPELRVHEEEELYSEVPPFTAIGNSFAGPLAERTVNSGGHVVRVSVPVINSAQTAQPSTNQCDHFPGLNSARVRISARFFVLSCGLAGRLRRETEKRKSAPKLKREIWGEMLSVTGV